MVAKASPLSITPQEKKSKKLKTKSPMLQDIQQNDKDLSPFAQMLLQSPKQQLQTSTKTSKNPHSHIINPSVQKKSISNHAQKLLTQKRFEIQNKQNKDSSEMQNQLREALNIKTPQKTLQDIQNIAKENNLNLSKIKLTQHKSKKVPKLSQDAQITLEKTKEANPSKKSNLSKKVASKIQPKIEHKPQTFSKVSQAKPENTPRISHLPQELQTNLAQDTQAPQVLQIQQVQKDSLLKEFLNQQKEDKETNQTQKNEKIQEPILSEVKKETQFKIAQSRETITHFSNRLKEEIANYKPPFTKLSMELNPRELGKLEVTITKKGKELQISINANNPNALQTFVQNQNDFRATLANVGFNNVELSFSQGESQKQNDSQKEQNQKRNKNSLEEHIDAPLASSMEIKMVQYA